MVANTVRQFRRDFIWKLICPETITEVSGVSAGVWLAQQFLADECGNSTEAVKWRLSSLLPSPPPLLPLCRPSHFFIPHKEAQSLLLYYKEMMGKRFCKDQKAFQSEPSVLPICMGWQERRK